MRRIGCTWTTVKHQLAVMPKLGLRTGGKQGETRFVFRGALGRGCARETHTFAARRSSSGGVRNEERWVLKPDGVEEGSASLLVLREQVSRPSPLLSVTMAQRTQC